VLDGFTAFAPVVTPKLAVGLVPRKVPFSENAPVPLDTLSDVPKAPSELGYPETGDVPEGIFLIISSDILFFTS
jgi:hypothetical protein